MEVEQSIPTNVRATRAAEVEALFLAGVEANLRQAAGTILDGSQWSETHRSQDRRVRSAMRDAGLHDREILRSMPKNAAFVITGSQRRWLFGRRVTCAASASALSPIEHYLCSNDPPPPIELTELTAHVKELTGPRGVRHVIGVCSPSGFSDEARRYVPDSPHVQLILIEPGQSGGWDVRPAGGNVPPEIVRLFDPEAVQQKLQRAEEEILARRVELLSGGLSAHTIAHTLRLPVHLTELAFRRIVTDNPDLRTTRQDGELILFRGATTDVENPNMSLTDRIRKLFSKEGDETRKINELAARRAQLTQRRDRTYDDISKLEQREEHLFREGRQTPSEATRRLKATQIKAVQDDIKRHAATAKMLSQQIEIISTDIHNLTLIQQGQSAQLPNTEDLTDHAVRAEEILEQLTADADLTDTLTVGATDQAMSTEEQAIFEQLSQPEPAKETKQAEETPAADADVARDNRESQPEADG